MADKQPIMPGQKYGMLTIIEATDDPCKFRCICECGRERIVAGYNIRSGNTRSCGCSRGRRATRILGREGYITALGYFQVEGCRLEHIVVAEKALGRPLPEGAQVHHVNEIKTDNRGSNLVICPNRAYHILLHTRARAYDACGHADWHRCSICKTYDDPINLDHRASKNCDYYRHKACHAKAELERTRKKRLALA